jgi:hypothetical protein
MLTGSVSYENLRLMRRSNGAPGGIFRGKLQNKILLTEYLRCLAPIGAGENFNFPSSRHGATIERGA